MKLIPIAPLLALLFSSCAALGGSSSSSELVYVVEASGGSWSAGPKARAAMESLELDELHMSGTHAVFRHSSKVNEGDIADALEEQGMSLESYKRERRPKSLTLYTVDTGITWAVTAGKVRAALMETTGAIDVYFEEEIEILMAGDTAELSTSKLEELLDEHEIEFSTIERCKNSG